MTRLVAVLGYSTGREGLHPICAARLEATRPTTTLTAAEHPAEGAEARAPLGLVAAAPATGRPRRS